MTGGEPRPDTVAFVSVSRGLGGPARSLLSVLDHLDEGVRCVLFAPPGDVLSQVRRRGLADHVVPMPWRPRFRQLGRVQAAIQLASYARRHRSELVAIHANGQSELNLAALETLVSGVRVVMWAHTSVASPTAGLLAPLWRRLGNRVAWLAVSETAARTLIDTLGLGRNQVRVVTNPIDPADVVATRDTHEGVRVAYLGRAALHKGFDLLAPIARDIGRAGIGLDLYVAPPTPHSPVPVRRPWEELNEASREVDVTLAGRRSDVRRIYGACDIVLCPSRAESFGRVAAGPMMNGLPVVASDLPAHRDLVGAADAGLLFPVGDATAAAAAIRRLAGDAELRRELGANGRAYVRRFEPDQVVPQIEATYQGR
jgi:glycosyltransferase involved in cell wall biosynthesis